ncbi:MAG: hypothetical protein BWK76_10070 [Desulfobulbaceae bacterium A2]|nr:MAG: hypothetical protein BWK76_10070 [Desulfobulbaceae bacterium A2]
MENWLPYALAAAGGAIAGGIVTSLVQRYLAGGKSASQLRREFDDYRQEVETHYGATAELFQSLTEQYRELARHLAQGARSLKIDLPDSVQLDTAPRKLITGPERAGTDGGEGQGNR